MKEKVTKRPDAATYDAWKIKPPCESALPWCSSGCPYWSECGELEYEDED